LSTSTGGQRRKAGSRTTESNLRLAAAAQSIDGQKDPHHHARTLLNVARMEENGRRHRHTHAEAMRARIEELREQIVGLLPAVRRFAAPSPATPHDADDLVQIGSSARDAVRSAPARFALSSWMFGILVMRDRMRLHARRRNRVFVRRNWARNIGDASSDAQAAALRAGRDGSPAEEHG